MIAPMAVAQRTSGQMSAAGKRAARVIFKDGPQKARYTEHRERAYAKAALHELAHLIDNKTPGIFVEQMAGMDAAAEDLHVRPERALAEIAQNADDCGATRLRFALRGAGEHTELLCAHNGSHVKLRDAVGMTFAYISGKRDDARSKGKFGIGLKTIAGMAGSFSVHCEPYHFTVERQRPSWTEPEHTIEGFWSPGSGETLLVLRLHDGYNAQGAVDWLEEWGVESMLFLDSLHRIEFLRLDDLEPLAAQELELGEPGALDLPLRHLDGSVRVRTVRDAADPQREWTIYSASVAAPVALRRAHKRRERLTPLGIAVPEHGETTALFAGLPLDEHCELPFSIHGQFDPDTSRAQIKKSDWNSHVIARVADLAGAILVHRYAVEPATAWPATPTREHTAGRDSWTRGQFEALVEEVRQTVADQARLPAQPEPVALHSLVYEAGTLDGLLRSADLARLGGGRVPLRRADRDKDGVWRDVLEDLERGQEVGASEAAEIFNWDDDDFGQRNGTWFVAVIEAVLSEWEGERVLDHKRCLLLADSRRVSPRAARDDGRILVRSAGRSALAEKLGLTSAVDAVFLDACKAKLDAREWINDTIEVWDKPTSEQALQALGKRAESAPLDLSDHQLLALRDAISKASLAKREELGEAIGRRVRVRCSETLKGGKRRDVLAKPAEAYLSPKIDGLGAEGFPQIAGWIPGLRWVQPGYATLLKTPRGSGRLAVRPLFSLLGAHASPRIERVPQTYSLHDESAAPLRRPLPDTQQVEVSRRSQVGEAINGLRDDHDSSDLVLVLDHIKRLRAKDRERAARALVLSLDREWALRYAAYTRAEAMYGYGWWNRRGPVPATWLARLQSTPFLTSELRRRCRPVDLVLRSDAYVAIIGEDRSAFCKEVREGDIAPEVAGALGFEPRPRASRILDQLTALRERQEAGGANAAEIAGRADVSYLALASYCREARPRGGRLTTRDRIDDRTVGQLRARFAQGLIQVAGQWHRPSEVFRGAPIFGTRRPFVSGAAHDLWDVLRVEEPSAADCIAVLTEITRQDARPSDQQLTSIYLRLDTELADGRRPRRVKNLPLLTGSGWKTERPIFAVAEEGLAQSLARQLPVWRAPCSLNAVKHLLDAAGVRLLDARTFEPQGLAPGHRAAGARIRPHFVAALRRFAEMVSKECPALYTAAPLSFDELEQLELAHSSKLEVRIPLGDSEYRVAPVDVFASVAHRLVAFRDPEHLGRHETGGLAVASLFGDIDPRQIAALWEIAWSRADPDNLGEAVQMARDEVVEGDPLQELVTSSARRKTARALVRGGAGIGPGTPPAPPKAPAATKSTNPPKPPRRRLRDISNAMFGEPQIAGDDKPGTRRRRKQSGLKDPPPAPPPSPGSSPPPGVREYDEHEKESLGFELLANALRNLDGRELGDYRALRGIGSDAIDDLRRFFELKAHEGAIPNEVSLTAVEVRRAVEERGKYFLAIVGGLETGDTTVRIFADPLVGLDTADSGSLTFAGVLEKRALVIPVDLSGATESEDE